MAGTATTNRSRRTGGEHLLGEGPGSIYMHAVAPRFRAGGPVAVCGHPLRGGTPRARDDALSADSFEQFVALSPDACPDCAERLGLQGLGDASQPAAHENEGTGKSWQLLGALLLGGSLGFAGLARTLVYVLGHR